MRQLNATFILILWMFGTCAPRAESKCAAFSVTVVAKLAPKPGQQQDVLVRVWTNRDNQPLEKTERAVSDMLTVTVTGDTFVSAGLFGSHNCSRRPEHVEITLFRGGVSVEMVKLDIERDFSRDRGEWRTKLPVVFKD